MGVDPLKVNDAASTIDLFDVADVEVVVDDTPVQMGRTLLLTAAPSVRPSNVRVRRVAVGEMVAAMRVGGGTVVGKDC